VNRRNGAGEKNKFQKKENIMKKNVSLLTVIFTLTLVFVGSHVVAAQTPDLSAQGSKFITLLSGGERTSAVDMFDDTMQKFLPEEKLKETWQTIQAQAGAFKTQGAIRKEKIQNYDAIYINCQFEKTPLDCRIVFDSNGKIAGLQFLPSISK
jgi:hypothetical protein